MKILVIGGTGELGRRLIPQLIADKHAVLATSRSDHRLHTIRSLGATAIALDLLDADAVRMACAGFRPDVIVHQATSLTGIRSLRHFDGQFRQTNRLRTGGLRILMEAAWELGVKRLVVQSFTGWPNSRAGKAIKTPVATSNSPIGGRVKLPQRACAGHDEAMVRSTASQYGRPLLSDASSCPRI